MVQRLEQGPGVGFQVFRHIEMMLPPGWADRLERRAEIVEQDAALLAQPGERQGAGHRLVADAAVRAAQVAQFNHPGDIPHLGDRHGKMVFHPLQGLGPEHGAVPVPENFPVVLFHQLAALC